MPLVLSLPTLSEAIMFIIRFGDVAVPSSTTAYVLLHVLNGLLLFGWLGCAAWLFSKCCGGLRYVGPLLKRIVARVLERPTAILTAAQHLPATVPPADHRRSTTHGGSRGVPTVGTAAGVDCCCNPGCCYIIPNTADCSACTAACSGGQCQAAGCSSSDCVVVLHFFELRSNILHAPHPSEAGIVVLGVGLLVAAVVGLVAVLPWAYGFMYSSVRECGIRSC